MEGSVSAMTVAEALGAFACFQHASVPPRSISTAISAPITTARLYCSARSHASIEVCELQSAQKNVSVIRCLVGESARQQSAGAIDRCIARASITRVEDVETRAL
jgi:hypothetical protein